MGVWPTWGNVPALIKAYIAMLDDRDDMMKEMEKNGFHLASEYTFLPYQYFLVFKVK